MLDNPLLSDIVIPAELPVSLRLGMAAPDDVQAKPAKWFAELTWPLLWVGLLSLGRNVLALAAPLYVLALYGRVLGTGNMQALLSLTGAVAAAALAAAAIDALRGRLLAGIGDRLEERFGTLMLRRATAPLTDVNTRPAAGLVGRDLDIIRHFTTGPAMLALIDLPWTPLFLLAIALLHWSFCLVAVGIAGGLVAVSLFAARESGLKASRANQTASRSYQFGEAVTRHADCAGTMGLGPALARRWQSLRREMLSGQVHSSRRTILFAAAARFAGLFAQSAILGCGAFLTIRHAIGGGAIFAAAMLLGRLLAPIEGAIAAWGTIRAARDTITHVRALPAPVQDSALLPRRVRGEITLEGVAWTPPGSSRPALRGITLKIEAGATLAVIGPSAAGKSTLARVLCGALRPGQGVVRLDGAELGAWNLDQLGAAIGYLPQDVALYPGTVAENIARFGDASEMQIVRAAKLAGAHDMIVGLPGGYATPVDDGLALLSNGQRQRVGLARALFNDPSILVLDEPNASLDAEGEAALIGCMVEARRRRRTVIMITHNTALVRVADFVATMVGGHILKVEQTSALLGRPARLAVTA